MAIGEALAKKGEKVNFNEFVKFGYQCNVYPALLSHDELIYVFRETVKDRDDDLQLLDIDHFKRALIRVAALAQDKLSSQ